MDQTADAGVRETLTTATEGAERLADAGQEAARTAGEAIEDGAARMDEQLASAAGRSTAAMEGAAEYGRAVAQGLQAIAEEWAACARAAAEKTLDRMNVLGQARNPTDLLNAQRDLIWGGFEDMLTAQQRIGQVSMSIMADAAQRMTSAPARMAA